MSQHKVTWRNNNNTAILPTALIVLALIAAGTMIALQTDHPSAIPLVNVSIPKLVAPAAPAASLEKSIDIGGGYVLKTNAEGGVVIPSTPLMVKSWPESSYKSLDIGGGYLLKTNGAGGMVVPSSSAIVKSGVVEATSKTIDLGGGYVLKMNSGGGAVVPSSPAILKSQPPAAYKTIDLGAGYTLVLDENGGTIQAPASRPVTTP